MLSLLVAQRCRAPCVFDARLVRFVYTPHLRLPRTHVLQVTDSAAKDRVVKKVQDTVLSKWQNEPNRIDKRALSLIYMAHASDVLENAFAPLSGTQPPPQA